MPAVVRLLVQRNARVDIKDKYGDLASDHAVEARTVGTFEIVCGKSTALGIKEDDDDSTPSSTPRKEMPTSFSSF